MRPLLLLLLLPTLALANPPSSPTASANADSSANADATADSANTVTSSTSFKGVRQAPAILAAATNTTAPCAVSRTIGASALGTGVGAGRSSIDRNCALLAAAESEFTRGNVTASVLLRCSVSYIREALGADCVKLLTPEKT